MVSNAVIGNRRSVALGRKSKVGFQTFASDGGEEFGALRQVASYERPEIVIYGGNAGDFTDAVQAVHAEKNDSGLRQADGACVRRSPCA